MNVDNVEAPKPSYRNRVGYHATLLWGSVMLSSAALVLGYTSTRDEIALRLKEDQQASLQQVVPQTLYDNDLLEDTIKLTNTDRNFGPEQITVYRGRQQDKLSALAFQVTGMGYAGPIQIMLGIDTSGKLLGVRVIAHTETPGLGDKIEIKKSNWIDSFRGLSLGNPEEKQWAVKKDKGIFDQFTGATITPRAVVNAIKQGLEFFHKHETELLHIESASVSEDETK